MKLHALIFLAFMIPAPPAFAQETSKEPAKEPSKGDSAAQTIESIHERLKMLDAAAASEPEKTAPVAHDAHDVEAEAPAAAPARPEKRKVAAVHKKAHRAPAGERSPQVNQSSPSVTRPSQTDSPVPESPQEEESRLTKNWGGPRKTLSDKGIDLALVYKAEFNRVFTGVNGSASTYLGNIDLRVSLDGDKLVGWKGGSAFIYVLNDHGGHPNETAGDVQVTSNIETSVYATRLYEAWLQQLAFDDKVSFLVGLHDLNSEFYATDTSGLFFNSSFGVGKDLSQTGLNGPSIFPVTAPAIRVRAEPSKSFYIETAAFEAKAGDPDDPRGTHVSLSGRDGLLLITEFAYVRGRDPERKDEKYGKYGLGLWGYTKTFDHQFKTVTDSDGNVVPEKDTSHGAYAMAEQALSDSVAVFARYGVASGEVNPVGDCLGTGIVFTGLLPTRDKDRFGLGLARVTASGEFKEAQEAAGDPVKDAETTLEANYRFEAIPGIALQPDFQYVINPGFSESVSHAMVGAFRIEMNF